MVYGRYVRRQIIFQQGNPATRIYAVKSGLLKAYQTDSGGKRQLMDLIGPGDVFALEGLYTGEYSVTVEILADSEICFFENARFLEMLSRNQPLSIEIIRTLSQTVVEYRSKITNFGTKTARARLASFFLRLLPQDLAPGAAKAEIVIPISRMEIADLIGVGPETVSRLFLLLTKQRIISVEDKRLKIRDLRRLRALTEPAAVA